jgi:hypothetical protein
VAQLRAVAGSDPDAPDLASLVGELLVKSPDFGRLWGRYEVRRAGAGDRVFRHPVVGTMTLAHETLDVNRAGGQRLITYLAAPGTPEHDAMVLLDRADAVRGDDPPGPPDSRCGTAVGPATRPDLRPGARWAG